MAASTGTGNYDAVVQAYNANTFATISTGHTVTLTDNVTGCNFFKIEAGATENLIKSQGMDKATKFLHQNLINFK